MYIPSFNKFEDKQEVINFMKRYSFGTIVTATNNLPIANHLPFIVEEKDDKIIISSHFAKANPQALDIVDNDVLVIFTEPHAYISPKHYEKETNVPTWNYIAVHAYGKARLLEGEQAHMELLERTINAFEPDYFQQWAALSQDYKSKMIKGIIGFELIVTDLQAKSKLSQNRTPKEQNNIIDALKTSSNTNESDIAAYMTSQKQ